MQFCPVQKRNNKHYFIESTYVISCRHLGKPFKFAVNTSVNSGKHHICELCTIAAN